MSRSFLAALVVVAGALGCASTNGSASNESVDASNPRLRANRPIGTPIDTNQQTTPSYTPSSVGAGHSHTLGGGSVRPGH